MQINTQNVIFQYSKHTVLIAIATLTLMSCSVFHEPTSITYQEPGIVLAKLVKKQSDIRPNDLTPFFKTNKQMRVNDKLLTEHIDMVNEILREYAEHEDVLIAVKAIRAQEKYKEEILLASAFILFPIGKFTLIGQHAPELFNRQTIRDAALLAQIKPTVIFGAITDNMVEHRITPLIHSASVTLYQQSGHAENTMWFKQSASEQWQQAFSLQWEPVNQALSGSIVWLDANTEYDLKINITENGKTTTKQYQFSTRPNSPPIDPEKVYYLADLYKGGSLDLAATGINGKQNGWAKIIGDGVVINADDEAISALFLGNMRYVMLENINIKGGKRYGIHADKAHHIWIKRCDISEFGRKAAERRRGIPYANAKDKKPINYDAGIYLKRTGTVVVEECEIHSPNVHANHWGYGHPRGATAMFINANSDIPEFSGQYIIRNNRFYGNAQKRFNDVIEGYGNRRSVGAFVRDSAIYNNYLAFANDDIIEMDGGQSNVLFYNNEVTQGYCGVSVAPNMKGPSYIFNNHIHSLGDERGKMWAAIKMGGLFSSPAGITHVFHNVIDVSANGIASARVDGDKTFWTHSQNNIILSSSYSNNSLGYGIFDTNQYANSQFINDFIFNKKVSRTMVNADVLIVYPHPLSYELNTDIQRPSIGSAILNVEESFYIPNFSFPNRHTFGANLSSATQNKQ